MGGFLSKNKRRDEVQSNHCIKQGMAGSTIQPNNPTKITDVNQFCLEKIFSYLDLEDLLNVADANKYLQLATYSPYARQNAKKTIEFVIDYDSSDKIIEYPIAETTNHTITISIKDFKTTLQMLRLFGHIFTDIMLYESSLQPNCHKFNRLMSYTNEYCAESLTSIDLWTVKALEEFKKPFTNIESVQLKESFPGDFNMSIIFPKLRRLICGRDCIPGSINPVYCPNLEHLEFVNDNPKIIDQNKYTIAAVLRLNPQLRSFEIGFSKFNVLRFISKYLQSIESLDISTESCYYDGNLMEFSNVVCFTIQFCHMRRMNFPLLLPQLKEFTIKSECEWNDSFIKFIKKHQSIEKITIETTQLISFENSLRLVKVLPTLQSINIIQHAIGQKLKLDIVLRYMPIFKRLKSFNFESRCDTISEDDIRTCCGKEWHITCTKDEFYDYFTLKPIEAIV